MISYQLLHTIAAELQAYRKKPTPIILFDGRDRGNYLGYSLDNLFAMFERQDPTGLSMAAMLNEMIEATINGSRVELSRVLREPGFIDVLKEILNTQQKLQEVLSEPFAKLSSRLQEALQAVSPDYGTPQSREITCCLRDAIFCMDSGLKLRWLQWEETAAPAPMPLSKEIRHFPDLPTFTDALRFELSWGAHLARIGTDETCVGLRAPGRVAFLSSMSINVHSGAMQQKVADSSHMAELYDLDTAVQRYPQWYESPLKPHGTSTYIDKQLASKMGEHHVDQIALLPRDRLIWLAMVVEMAAQQMFRVSSSDVELAEIANRALGFEVKHANLLPTVVRPNWQITDCQLEDVFASLDFSPWEKCYLAPAIAGMQVQQFLPQGEATMGLNLESRELVVWNIKGQDDQRDYEEKHVRITPTSSAIVGTRDEVSNARLTILTSNLVNYLLRWGNLRFQNDWKEFQPRARELLAANLPNALGAGCVTIKKADTVSGTGLTLFSQSPKHRTYRPNCFFNANRGMTHFAYFFANTAEDLIEAFGLASEEELPPFLQGWSRNLGWTTSDRSSDAVTTERWVFADTGRYTREYEKLCTMKVVFNAASVSPEFRQIKEAPTDMSPSKHKRQMPWPFTEQISD